MEHVIVRETDGEKEVAIARHWSKTTLDGDLLDLDVFEHRSTILLGAVRTGERPMSRDASTYGGARVGYLPVQRPLMLENLIFRPGLTDRERALIITRMTEAAVSEAFRVDAGELYFLCREPSTCAFAESHKWKRIDGEEGLGLKLYRLNLRETFAL